MEIKGYDPTGLNRGPAGSFPYEGPAGEMTERGIAGALATCCS